MKALDAFHRALDDMLRAAALLDATQHEQLAADPLLREKALKLKAIAPGISDSLSSIVKNTRVNRKRAKARKEAASTAKEDVIRIADELQRRGVLTKPREAFHRKVASRAHLGYSTVRRYLNGYLDK